MSTYCSPYYEKSQNQSVKKDLLKENSVEVTKLNYSQKSMRLVNNFYNQGEMPTVYRIYFAIKDNDSIPNVSMRTLKNVLRHLRFTYLLDNNTVLLQSFYCYTVATNCILLPTLGTSPVEIDLNLFLIHIQCVLQLCLVFNYKQTN